MSRRRCPTPQPELEEFAGVVRAVILSLLLIATTGALLLWPSWAPLLPMRPFDGMP